MDWETAKRTIDYIYENHPKDSGIIFFGGEPLLQKNLIKQIIEYGRSINPFFHYKMTTNGIALDDEFIKYAKGVDLDIALSVDGSRESHNTHRKFPNGESSFELVIDKMDSLLNEFPISKILMTVTPDTLKYYAESFEYLIEKGVRYLIVSLDYSADWTDEDILELENQYKKLAILYEKYIYEERKFYFSPFEMKFTNHIRQSNSECFHCHLAQKQISISFSGDIYPCTQFVQDGVNNKEYKLGDVFSGIDEEFKNRIYSKSQEQQPACLECDYNLRCNNKCSCLNWQLTGEINELSPKICESERILFPIVDELGKRLYEKRAPMFIQKHYNAVYPIISLIEDKNFLA
jgi:uncharacterized protein